MLSARPISCDYRPLISRFSEAASVALSRQPGPNLLIDRRISGSPGGQAIDVPVEHAKCRSDERVQYILRSHAAFRRGCPDALACRRFQNDSIGALSLK